MKKVAITLLSAILLVSCGQQSAERQQLQAENDSLKLENAKNAAQMDDMLSILNEIETDFQTIREAENYLAVEQKDLELSSTKRERIRQNMLVVQETLKKNKEQISQLEERLKNSNVQNSTLQQTIKRLSGELEQRATMIASLQKELEKRNIRIQELDVQVGQMSEELEDLSLTNLTQAERLQKQDKDLNVGYYCFGTSRELKDQNILSGGGLLSKSKLLQDGFNQDYFISVDIRDLKEIPLFAKKAKLLTTHPQGSYKLEKDDENNLTLEITDYRNFWSMGKYLVIEVDL